MRNWNDDAAHTASNRVADLAFIGAIGLAAMFEDDHRANCAITKHRRTVELTGRGDYIQRSIQTIKLRERLRAPRSNEFLDAGKGSTPCFGDEPTWAFVTGFSADECFLNQTLE